MMWSIRKVAIAVLVLSFLTFIALFGRLPALRNTPIGFLHRCVWHQLPEFVLYVDKRLTGGRLTSSLTRLVHYLAYEKHPVVLILFLGLVTSASSIFLSTAWTQLSSEHHFLICLLLPLPYVFTFLCVRSTTSHITPANHAAEVGHYPYDFTNYYPGRTCTTCFHIKPARSKHCSICQACVARHDHHCVWINNCVGRGNYRWFLGLLASLGVLLNYGTYLAYILLRYQGDPELQKGRGATFWNLFEIMGAAIASDRKLGAVGLLAMLTAPLAWGLFGYHVYLIWAGTTTNETQKWEELKYDMADGLVYKGRKGKLERNAEGTYHDQATNKWPAVSDQVIERTESGDPPLVSTHDIDRVDGSWERCWHLMDIVNLYDLGFWDNLKDALDVL